MINSKSANSEKDEFEKLKEKWRNFREERMRAMFQIITPLDDLLRIIRGHEKISLKDLHTIFKVPKSRIEGWLLILEKKELVELQYPLLGRAKVKINGKTGSDTFFAGS